MKTSNFYYMIVALMLILASCSDNDNDYTIKEKELPQSVTLFLNDYLPNNKFVSAQRDGYGVTLYSVKLENDIEAVFSSEGEWKYLQSEQGLPETVKSLLSENSRNALNEKYPSEKITMISSTTSNRAIFTLNNKKRFQDIYAHEGDVLAEILDGDGEYAIPEKTKEFIKKYLSTRSLSGENSSHYLRMLKFSGFRGDIYRMLVRDNSFVDFYSDGEWFFMHNGDGENIIQNNFLFALPDEMLATLLGKEPMALAILSSITRYNNYSLYGFNLQNSFVLINSENKLIEPPLEKAKEFINKVFLPEKELTYEVRCNTSSPYFLRYAFITYSNSKISLVTDVNGNMRNVSAGPITSDPESSVAPLPRTLLEMFPNDILNYLDINYPDKPVLHISHSYSVSQDDTADQINFTLRIPNNLKVIIFDSKTGKYIREYDMINQ